MKPIKLGDIRKRKITGVEGRVIAKCEYETGCVQFQLQPYGLVDGKKIESEWVKDLSVESDNIITIIIQPLKT